MTDHTDCGLPEESSTRLGGERWEDGVMAALRRAAKQAHLIAHQTGTGVVEQRNGKMGVHAPDPAMYEDLIPAPFVESSEA